MVECRVCGIEKEEEDYQLDSIIYPVCYKCIEHNNKLIQDD